MDLFYIPIVAQNKAKYFKRNFLLLYKMNVDKIKI